MRGVSALVGEGTKRCSGCDDVRPLGDFAKHPNGAGGVNNRCKSCKSTYDKRRADAQCYERTVRRYRRHGITLEIFEQMLADQGGVCAIFGEPEQENKRLAVDHDHACCPGGWSCGKCIRGLLCGNCNKSLGSMRDDPERLRRAAEYLERQKIH